MSVSPSAFPAMHFVVLDGIVLKLVMGAGDGPLRLQSVFSKRRQQRSKAIQRSSCFRSTLWLLNVVGRTPDQSVMYCLSQRSYRGQPGQAGVQLLRNVAFEHNAYRCSSFHDSKYGGKMLRIEFRTYPTN